MPIDNTSAWADSNVSSDIENAVESIPTYGTVSNGGVINSKKVPKKKITKLAKFLIVLGVVGLIWGGVYFCSRGKDETSTEVKKDGENNTAVVATAEDEKKVEEEEKPVQEEKEEEGKTEDKVTAATSTVSSWFGSSNTTSKEENKKIEDEKKDEEEQKKEEEKKQEEEEKTEEEKKKEDKKREENKSEGEKKEEESTASTGSWFSTNTEDKSNEEISDKQENTYLTAMGNDIASDLEDNNEDLEGNESTGFFSENSRFLWEKDASVCNWKNTIIFIGGYFLTNILCASCSTCVNCCLWKNSSNNKHGHDMPSDLSCSLCIKTTLWNALTCNLCTCVALCKCNSCLPCLFCMGEDELNEQIGEHEKKERVF